jgi:hypothetical protein
MEKEEPQEQEQEQDLEQEQQRDSFESADTPIVLPPDGG